MNQVLSELNIKIVCTKIRPPEKNNRLSDVEALSNLSLHDFDLINNFKGYLKEVFFIESWGLEFYKDSNDKIFCSFCAVPRKETARVYIIS